jgi:predicted tellurium resistance membrane protein TerC
MSLLLDPQAWLSLLTLTFLEIILGVDNIIFISILAGKVKPEQRAQARKLGLLFALVTRVLLLCTLAWLAKLTEPLFTAFAHSFSGRDLILIFGGLFLIAKSTHEIHGSLEGPEGEAEGRSGPGKAVASLFSVVTQIAFIDIIFSLDSVITAVGIAQHLPVMIAAVVLSIMVMLWLSGPISDFVERHPTIKMLALSFLIMIGVMLVIDGFGQHVSKAYIYFAMGFSLAVEMLNIRMRTGKNPVHLHSRLDSSAEPSEPK